MSTIGTSRGGVQNFTQVHSNSTQGFANTTPKMYAASPSTGGDNVGIDLNNSYQPQQETKRLESIVDRIVRRRGPPQSSLGNPGPVGLAAFAATTFMLSCWNAGLLVSTTSNVVLPMALWYGGIAQLLAGMWEFAANNTFGATAFTSYGAFWLSFATLEEFWGPTGYAAEKDVNAAVGMYLMAWTIFTGYMMLASLRMSWSLAAVLIFLEITFACLTAARFTADANSAEMITKAGGWFGIITAWCAWYASAAVVINGTWGCQLLPVGVIGPLTTNSKVVRNIPAIKRRLTDAHIDTEEEDANSVHKEV